MIEEPAAGWVGRRKPYSPNARSSCQAPCNSERGARRHAMGTRTVRGAAGAATAGVREHSGATAAPLVAWEGGMAAVVCDSGAAHAVWLAKSHACSWGTVRIGCIRSLKHANSTTVRVHLRTQTQTSQAQTHARAAPSTHARTHARADTRTCRSTHARTHGSTHARTHERRRGYTHASTHARSERWGVYRNVPIERASRSMRACSVDASTPTSATVSKRNEYAPHAAAQQTAGCDQGPGNPVRCTSLGVVLAEGRARGSGDSEKTCSKIARVRAMWKSFVMTTTLGSHAANHATWYVTTRTLSPYPATWH